MHSLLCLLRARARGTGASLSLISERTWRKTLGGVPLENSEIKLRTYSGEGLQVLGKKNVMVKYGKQEFCLPLIVIKGDGVSLFGRNWLEVIKLDWRVINKLSSPLDQLLSKHQEVFQEGLGTLKDIKATLTVKPGATVLAPKRLECVLFQFYVIVSVILHAMDKLNIPQ